MSRDRVALGRPGGQDLTGFPPATLTTSTPLWRGHRRTLPDGRVCGPWWFSSTGGRFDLPAPDGTCYLAYDEQTAVRETIGDTLTAGQALPAVFADERVVSALRLPSPITAADTCHSDAVQHGLTREISTVTPYGLPQRWAAEFHAAGHGGIQYQTRFTTTPAANAAAVFGPGGDAGGPADASPEPFAAAAQRAGITITGPPRNVRIIDPPAST